MDSESLSSNLWFPDTTAMNHFTLDFFNLNLDSSVYQGSDQVSIGDGSTIPIQHIGTDHIQSLFGNFLLFQLFYVPFITRNLL